MKKNLGILLVLFVISIPVASFAGEKMLLKAQDQPTMLPQTPEEETIHPKQPNVIFEVFHGIWHILVFPFEVIGGIITGGK